MKEQFVLYLDQFLDYLIKNKNYSILTAKTYKAPILEAIKLGEIYEEDMIYFNITKYRIKISSQTTKTINKKLSSIKSFCSYLTTKKLNIKLVGATTVKSAQTLPKPIQTKTIFDTIKRCDLEHKLIILFIYSFGVRISELASLKLEDIAQDWIIVNGKGNKQRQIPSNNVVDKLIKQYISQTKPRTYLFEKDNKPLTIRQLQYRLKVAFNFIGVDATPHQLRHSFATDLLNNGARINDISQLLGHNSLKATGIYTKLNTNTKLTQYNMAHPLNK